VEKAGGTMEIRSRPFFELTVTVPLEGEDEI
jgi:signal transduction histidine kinase